MSQKGTGGKKPDNKVGDEMGFFFFLFLGGGGYVWRKRDDTKGQRRRRRREYIYLDGASDQLSSITDYLLDRPTRGVGGRLVAPVELHAQRLADLVRGNQDLIDILLGVCRRHTEPYPPRY